MATRINNSIIHASEKEDQKTRDQKNLDKAKKAREGCKVKYIRVDHRTVIERIVK